VLAKKSLVFGAIGLISMMMIWLGPSGDTSTFSPGSEFAMQDAGIGPACSGHHPSRCTFDIRYAYPAAELYVVPEDVYF
jgi:hypothetical protein